MNNLEELLCKATRNAFDTYLYITNEWLSHAPEHFIQNYIFVEIGKKEWMYAEATRKKIMDGEGKPRVGRPPADKGKRFDLISWARSTNTVRAVIEIKKCWQMSDALRKDAARIKRALHGKNGAKAGYLIVYTEAKSSGRSRNLEAKLKAWASELELQFLNDQDFLLGDDGNWNCGFAIFRTLR